MPIFEIKFIARIEPVCHVCIQAPSEEEAEEALGRYFQKEFSAIAHESAHMTYQNAGAFAQLESIEEIEEVSDPADFIVPEALAKNP